MSNAKTIRKHFAFAKERDIGENINASLQFVRFYGKWFYQAILFLVMPFGLISGIAAGIFFVESTKDIVDILRDIDSKPLEEVLTVPYLVFLLASLLEAFMSVVVCHAFIKLCVEKSGDLSRDRVWAVAKTMIVKAIALTLLLFILFVVVFVVLVLFMSLVGKLNSIGVVMTAFLAMVGVVCYFLVSSSLSYAIGMLKGRSTVEAIKESFQIVYRNWWSTFLLIVVISFISFVINTAVSLPTAFMQWFISQNTNGEEGSGPLYQALLVLSRAVAVATGSFVRPVAYIALSMHLFSLKEKEEHLGLKERISLVGIAHHEAIDEEEEEEYR